MPLPRVNHVFAEKCLVHELVKLHNDTTYDPLIFQKIEENSHSLLGFSKSQKLCYKNIVSSVQLEIAMYVNEITNDI